MLLEKRIEAFSKVGDFFDQFSRNKIEEKNDIPYNQLFFDPFKLQNFE